MALIQIHKVSRGASGLQIRSEAWLMSQTFLSVLKMCWTKNDSFSRRWSVRGQAPPADAFVYNSCGRRGSISTCDFSIPRLFCRPIWGHSRWWKSQEESFTTNMPKCLVKHPHTQGIIPSPGSDSCLGVISSVLFPAKADWFEPEVFQHQKKYLGCISLILLFPELPERILCHAEYHWLQITFPITTVKTEQLDLPKYGFSLCCKLMFLWHGSFRNGNFHSFSSDVSSEIQERISCFFPHFFVF